MRYHGKPLMNVRAKTALLATAISIGLTVVKFVMYRLSGSLAVYSEAWHSLTDVVTSLIVFFAVRSSVRRKPPEPRATEPDNGARGLRRGLQEVIRVHPELKIAFVIALFLLVLSISILIEVFRAATPTIQRPILTGVIFVIFSVGSYFLYRFKTAVGEKEKSAALTADGLHSKADMLITLFTGFSLILYRFGFNLDRVVGGIIAALIFMFAIETMVNVIVAHIRRSEEYRVTHKSHEIVRLFFDSRSYVKLAGYIDARLAAKRKLSRAFSVLKHVIRWAPYAVGIALVLAYLATARYSVQLNEEAIVERFGKAVSPGKAAQPGLHLKCPWPIDRVHKFNTREIRELNIGNVVGSKAALLWTRPHGDETHFLSGDNNFFNPYVVIHYRIKGPHDYYYQQVEPERLLKQVSYRILTEMYTTQSFYSLAIYGREAWMNQGKQRIQARIDELRSGLEIVNLFLKDFHPPRRIAGSFEKVIASYQIKQDRINRAIGWRYTQLPAAQANAYKELAKARAYVTDKTRRSEGESEGFLRRLGEYKKHGAIARRHLYLKAMVKTLQNNDKVLLDPEASVNDLWLTRGQFRASGALEAD